MAIAHVRDEQSGLSKAFRLFEGHLDWMVVLQAFMPLKIDSVQGGFPPLQNCGCMKGCTRNTYADVVEIEVQTSPALIDAAPKRPSSYASQSDDHSRWLSAFEALDRLVVKEKDGMTRHSGTVVRVRADGLLVSARHACVKGGVLLELYAFGGRLECVGASPSDDVIFLRGNPVRTLNWWARVSYISGTGSRCWGFSRRWAPSTWTLPSNRSPQQIGGTIVKFNSTGSQGIVDYKGRMPVCSGGAVLLEATHMAGIHLGEGVLNNTSQVLKKPPWGLERDPNKLWSKREDSVEADDAVGDDEMLQESRHDVSDIGQLEDSLGVYVPSPRLVKLLIDLGLQGECGLRQAFVALPSA